MLVAFSSVLVQEHEIVAVAVANEAPSGKTMSVLVSDDVDISGVLACQNPMRGVNRKKDKHHYRITEPKINHVDLVPYLLKNW
jgi:hypothetical protein